MAIWNVTTGRKIKILRGTWTVLHILAMHPNGKLLATSSTRRVGNDFVQEIKLWEIESGKELATVATAIQKRPLLGIAFSPDGSAIAIGKEDGSIELKDVASVAFQR